MKSQNSLLAMLAFMLVLPDCLWAQSGTAGPQAPESLPQVELHALLKEALERNPELQAARRTVEAKRDRIPQARAWPDPTLTVSYGGNLLPPYALMRRDPSSARQFTAMEEIPSPGKTRLRGQIATREADAELLAYESVYRRIAAQIKQAYFDLYFVEQSSTTLRQERAVLERFRKVAEVRYSVGKAAQQDVLKAQVELTRLSERETLLDQQRQTLVAQLNGLRNLPPDAPLGPVGEVQPHLLSFALEDLEKAAEANFPELKRAQTQVDANRLSVALAQKEVRPNFSVGSTYMQRDGLPDMYGISFSTSLPVFRRRKQDMAMAEAAANLEASRLAEASELALLRYRVKEDYLQAQAAERLMSLYSQALLPQTRLTLESSLPSYETGATDFLSVLTNFTAVLDSELANHQRVADHEKALARLEELTGLDLLQ
jgi:cobalt-zinc-cadmium efflux system outer membrane protein